MRHQQGGSLNIGDEVVWPWWVPDGIKMTAQAYSDFWKHMWSQGSRSQVLSETWLFHLQIWIFHHILWWKLKKIGIKFVAIILIYWNAGLVNLTLMQLKICRAFSREMLFYMLGSLFPVKKYKSSQNPWLNDFSI